MLVTKGMGQRLMGTSLYCIHIDPREFSIREKTAGIGKIESRLDSRLIDRLQSHYKTGLYWTNSYYLRKGATGQRTQSDDSYYSTSQSRGKACHIIRFASVYAYTPIAINSITPMVPWTKFFLKWTKKTIDGKVKGGSHQARRQLANSPTWPIWCFSPIRFVSLNWLPISLRIEILFY